MKLSHEEIVELLFYGIKKNGMESKSIDSLEIRKIFNRYNDLRIFFLGNCKSSEFDTFKDAVCLLEAINRSRLYNNKVIIASIAVDVAYKMCEKPYCDGKKMEEVDFERLKEDDKYMYNTAKNKLIDSLVCGNVEPLNYYIYLELIYQSALDLKHKAAVKTIGQIMV